ncbi:MAG: S9 family peptidase [Pseudomonadota bacterium]
MIRRIFWLLAVSAWLPALATEIPVRDFVKRPEYGEVRISPGGEYLAVTVPEEDRTSLGFVRLSDMKLIGTARLRPGEHVHAFWWVNDERIVIALAVRSGSLVKPSPTGELFGINFDGSKKLYLHGARGDYQLGSRIARVTREYSWATMVDPLIDDAEHAIVEVHAFQDVKGTAFSELFRLNVYTGQRTKMSPPPATGDASYLVDRQGQVRYARILDRDYRVRTFWKPEGKEDWVQENAGALQDAQIDPLGFSRDGKSVFLAITDSSAHCLMRRVLADGSQQRLACDFNEVLFSFDNDVPIALVSELGRREIHRLDTTHPDVALLATTQRSFGGDLAEPVSATRDGSKVVLRVYSDRNPGDYYLFDKARKKADYLISARSWLEPAQMSERWPVEFSARDNYRLHGYVTMPRGAETKKLPLVVLPHGGPFFVRDSWEWNEDAQLLASRGYAVLQVNFRGSGGYGLAHINAAKRAWGTMMIDDITDGTRWAVAQGIADPARMCIYGGSYGGYAALMSAVREPDLYRCVVGYAGVYDLDSVEWGADFMNKVSGQSYFRDYIGSGSLLREQSPLTYIEKLKAPVLIVHGEADTRSPYNQAKELRKALAGRQHRYEWLSKPGEGHGFYKDANREEFYTRLLAFLEKYIGAGNSVAPEPSR